MIKSSIPEQFRHFFFYSSGVDGLKTITAPVYSLASGSFVLTSLTISVAFLLSLVCLSSTPAVGVWLSTFDFTKMRFPLRRAALAYVSSDEGEGCRCSMSNLTRVYY